MLDFSLKEWAAIPADRAVSLQLAHLTSFSAGSLRSCRAALLRLQAWLELNCLAEVCTDFACSGGVLAMCAQDMQAISRGSAGGASVPLSLRNSWRFAQLNLGLVGLRADAPIMSTVCAAPSRTPSPALAATVAMLFHFITLSHHANALVAHYAAGCVLCIVAPAPVDSTLPPLVPQRCPSHICRICTGPPELSLLQYILLSHHHFQHGSAMRPHCCHRSAP